MPTRNGRSKGRPGRTLDSLIASAGALKGELVRFGQSDRFLPAFLEYAAEFDTPLNDSTATFVADAFLLEHPLADGRTVLDYFIQERRPPLALSDRAMLRGWADVVTGLFEVDGRGHGLRLRNLVDDLDYEVHATAGRAALAPIGVGSFLHGRLVPLGHQTDAWLLSGNSTVVPPAEGPAVAQAALKFLTAHPASVRRNPRLVRRAQEIQRDHRERFIELVGSDQVILSPAEAENVLRAHYARLRDTAGAPTSGSTVSGVDPDAFAALPASVRAARTVGLVFDEESGLSYYAELDRVQEFLRNPKQSDRAGASRLRDYLDDDSVPATLIRRLVRHTPERADDAFRIALGDPGFRWDGDGETLLAQRKPRAGSATSATSVIGDRLAALLGMVRPPSTATRSSDR